MKASSSFRFPRACNSSARACRCLPACPAPTAGTGDGRSGKGGIRWVFRATLSQYPRPTRFVEHGSRVLQRTTAAVRRLGLKSGSIGSQWASLSSHRPHALLPPVFLHAQNREIASTTIYETS